MANHQPPAVPPSCPAAGSLNQQQTEGVSGDNGPHSSQQLQWEGDMQQGSSQQQQQQAEQRACCPLCQSYEVHLHMDMQMLVCQEDHCCYAWDPVQVAVGAGGKAVAAAGDDMDSMELDSCQPDLKGAYMQPWEEGGYGAADMQCDADADQGPYSSQEEAAGEDDTTYEPDQGDAAAHAGGVLPNRRGQHGSSNSSSRRINAQQRRQYFFFLWKCGGSTTQTGASTRQYWILTPALWLWTMVSDLAATSAGKIDFCVGCRQLLCSTLLPEAGKACCLLSFVHE